MENNVAQKILISDYGVVKQVSEELADYYKQAMSFYVLSVSQMH